MTTEQKARAYDEALKRAKAAIDIAADKDLVGGVVRTIFPQIRESEDDRIRKELIEFIKWSVDRHFMRQDFHQAKRPSEWIAYLEKQKYDRMKPIYDARESFESALEKAWNDYHNGYENVDKLEDGYVECAHAKGFREGYLFGLEKQKEQNGEDEEYTDFTIYRPLKNEKGKYECIPYSFYGSLTSFSEDKDLIDFLHTCFYTKEECEEWIKQQEEQKSVKDKIIEDTISYLNGGMCFCNSMEELKYRSNLAYRLKSLRPVSKESLQPHWKPSEEQMNALLHAMSKVSPATEDSAILTDLYEQLKKLM